MQNLTKNLLAIGISIGLSDREAFVKKVSGVIEEYQEDPDKAEKWAKVIIDYLEQMKDNIRMESVIKSSIGGSDVPGKKDVEDLTNAIKELTAKLQEKKNG